MLSKYKFTLTLILTVIISGYGQLKVSAIKHRDRIDVLINKNLFTTYIFSEEEKYPFFFPVNGPSTSGITSMRNANYPHHSSLFFGCDKVNGGNFWQEGLERGQIISLRSDLIPSGDYKVIIDNENTIVGTFDKILRVQKKITGSDGDLLPLEKIPLISEAQVMIKVIRGMTTSSNPLGRHIVTGKQIGRAHV